MLARRRAGIDAGGASMLSRALITGASAWATPPRIWTLPAAPAAMSGLTWDCGRGRTWSTLPVETLELATSAERRQRLDMPTETVYTCANTGGTVRRSIALDVGQSTSRTIGLRRL